MRRIAVVGAALGLACTQAGTTQPTAPKGPAPQAATDSFRYVELRTLDAAPPARYSAPIPADVAAVAENRDDAPPFSAIARAVCAGDKRRRNELASVIAEASSAGATLDELEGAYLQAFSPWCGEKLCPWIGRLTSSAPSEEARAFWWQYLSNCNDAATYERFSSGAPSARAFLRWYRALASPPRLEPRQIESLRLGIEAALQSGTHRTVLAVLSDLGEIDDPRTVELAIALYSHEDLAPAYRGAIIFGMQSNPSAKAQEFAARHCGDDDPALCEFVETRRRDLERVLADLDGWVTDASSKPHALARAHPNRRAEILDALERCATNPADADGQPALRCLVAIAAIERSRAVAVTSRLSSPVDPLAELASVLQRYPDAADLDAELDALGLTPTRHRVREPHIFVEDALRFRGRLDTFDGNAGDSPPGSDELLWFAARLVAPDLDGVIFEEARASSGYVLVAYMDGKRHEARARDLDGWYDFPAIIGMLNALARHRAKNGRFVVLPIEDELVTVVGADASAIDAAVKAKLIALETDYDAAIR
jgi:hypothetical protein